MKLVMKNVTGETVSIFVQYHETFEELKKRIQDEVGVLLDLQKLSVKGRPATHDLRVIDYFSQQEPQNVSKASGKCAVPTCPNTKTTCLEKVFFPFPQEKTRCHQWLLYCQRDAKAAGIMTPFLQQPHSQMCSDHFRKDQFIKNTTKLLKRYAVPCVTPDTSSGDASDGNAVLCRLCSKLCKNSILIFDDAGMNLGIADKINSSLPVVVKITDPLPKQLCQACFKILLTCHSFSKATLRAEKILWSKFKERGLNSLHFTETDSVDSSCKSVHQDIANATDQLENDSDKNSTEASQFYGCPLCSHGKMIKRSGLKTKPTSLIAVCEKNDDNVEADSEVIADSVVLAQNICTGRGDNVLVDNGNTSTIRESDEMDVVKNSPNVNERCTKIVDVEEMQTFLAPGSTVSAELQVIPNLWEDLECGEYFLQEKEVVDQEKEHFICSFCGSEFGDRALLLEHLAAHSESKGQEGGSLFLLSDSGKREEVLSLPAKPSSVPEPAGGSKSAPHRCPSCRKTFRSEARLAIHQRLHEGKAFPEDNKPTGRLHCCKTCGKTFRSAVALGGHQRRAHGGKPSPLKIPQSGQTCRAADGEGQECRVFMCKLCLEAFPNTEHAVGHTDSAHGAQAVYNFEMHTVGRLFRCNYCDRCFTESAHLDSHRGRHSAALPFECRTCGAGHPSWDRLAEHVASHSTPAVEFPVPTVFVCEYCEQHFPSRVTHSAHLTVHSGPDPYQCGWCEARFDSWAAVSAHRDSHGVIPVTTPDALDATVDTVDPLRPHRCHYCPKSFSTEDALVKHIRAHTGEKPFICEHCGKGFSQSSGLYTHRKLVHSDERPYPCPDCPRTFKIKGDRDTHARIHSGTRPYKCGVCGKAFMTQHVWSQHARIHTGVRPYECDVCGWAFRRSYALTIHRLTHTGEKPNACDRPGCAKRYRQRGDLLKHRKRRHPQD